MNGKLLLKIPTALWIMPLALGLICMTGARAQNSKGTAQMLKGEGSFNDWNNERPGNHYIIKGSDLPKPYATDSAPNQSKVVPRPADAWPKVPDGFKINQALTGLDGPRTIVTAPNGDLFVAESNAGRIRVLRGFSGDGRPFHHHGRRVLGHPALHDRRRAGVAVDHDVDRRIVDDRAPIGHRGFPTEFPSHFSNRFRVAAANCFQTKMRGEIKKSWRLPPGIRMHLAHNSITDLADCERALVCHRKIRTCIRIKSGRPSGM
jgi:hypothetical protein